MATLLTATRLIRFVLASATFLFAVAALPAQDKEKTHAAKPAELLAAISHADKIVVYDGTPAIAVGGGEAAPSILYSSVNPQDILELKQSIIMEPPREWFRCACYPSMDITLSRRGEEIGVISVFEELTIGFSRWSGDVRLADRDKFLRWFDVRGITGPRRAIENQQTRERADQIAADRWLEAMPSDLRTLWPQVLKDPQWWSIPPEAVRASARVLKPALANEYPDVNQRIRSLFGWFGSGSGKWSGYYAYEDVPSHMLLEYSASELISALREKSLTDSESEGAARFFVGYTPGALFRLTGDTTLIAHLPDELKNALLEHVAKTGDLDKIQATRKAFREP